MRSRARAMLRGAPETELALTPIRGRARLGRRTKALVKRLGPEDIAVIDHADLDRVAAEDLIASRVKGIINLSPSSTDRYPNAGPLLLVRAGIMLVDAPGADLFEAVSDGDELVIAGGVIRVDGEVVARGEHLTAAKLEERHAEQRTRIDRAIADFAANTAAHVREEGDLLAGDIELPRTRTVFRDRHVLIVVRGTTYRRDLKALRAYIQDVRPLLVGVDGGADAILEEGMTPDVVLGDMDSATDRALRCGAEVIVHAYSDGRAPGSERLDEIGVEHLVAPAIGTSQDVAMLLAFENGAELIVSVGAQFNLLEFLDKNRAGMSSTFLTRLRIGEILVDAKGVSRLYNPGVSNRMMLVFAFVAALLTVIVVLISAPLRELADLIWLKIEVLLEL
ncbi:MAG: putative cytokinetic ring protein SteA [Actinomycetota bacterium]|nr:putative cytokinetic ring protein SteA [Actinomycetota bacterium]